MTRRPLTESRNLLKAVTCVVVASRIRNEELAGGRRAFDWASGPPVQGLAADTDGPVGCALTGPTPFCRPERTGARQRDLAK